MNISDYLSEDGLAMLLLCSHLGRAEEPDAPEPFRPSEWNDFAQKLAASEFKTPAGLTGQGAIAIAASLELLESDGERVARLLGRSGQVSRSLNELLERGIWAVSRLDARYPARLRETLKHQAPTVLFGSGDITLLNQPGIAVIGSRTLDQTGVDFAREVGRKAAAAKRTVVSGGARGTDRLAMDGALQADGKAIGVMADSLERTIRQPDVRQFLQEEALALLTPFAPDAGFSIGAAMGRNKVIYGLSSHAVVVSSDLDKGGTWAGATEALKGGWCPVFVRAGANVPEGNTALIKKGGLALTHQELAATEDLPALLAEKTPEKAVEQDLFGL